MHELKWEGLNLYYSDISDIRMEIPSDIKNDKIKNAKYQGLDIVIYMDSGNVHMLSCNQETGIIRIDRIHTQPRTDAVLNDNWYLCGVCNAPVARCITPIIVGMPVIEVKCVNRLRDKEGRNYTCNTINIINI